MKEEQRILYKDCVFIFESAKKLRESGRASVYSYRSDDPN